MLNPALLVDAFVAALQSIDALVDAMNGNPENIYAWHYISGSDQALKSALSAMKRPSMLAAFEGAQPGNFNGSTLVKDRIAVYYRPPNQAGEVAPAGPEEIWWMMNNLPVLGGTMNLRFIELLPGKWQTCDTPSLEHMVDTEGEDWWCAHYVFPQWGDQTN